MENSFFSAFIRNCVAWNWRGRASARVWRTRQIYWNSCINDFLIKFYCSRGAGRGLQWHTRRKHNRLHERLAHTHAVPPWNDLIDVEHTHQAPTTTTNRSMQRKLLRLFRVELVFIFGFVGNNFLTRQIAPASAGWFGLERATHVSIEFRTHRRNWRLQENAYSFRTNSHAIQGMVIA